MAYRRKIDRNREVVILRDLFNWKFSRIAEIHGGLDRSTVRKLYVREKKNHPDHYADVATANAVMKKVKIGFNDDIVNDIIGSKSTERELEILKETRAKMTDEEWDTFTKKLRATVTMLGAIT